MLPVLYRLEGHHRPFQQVPAAPLGLIERSVHASGQ